MADFNTTYSKYIQPNEGYFANLKGDKGGLTYGGISSVIHPEWVGWPIVYDFINGHGGIDNIKNNTRIPEADSYVKEFFYQWWLKTKMDQINSQAIADIFFDWIVNSGTTTPTKKVQTLVHVNPDGIIGPDTLKAINAAKVVPLYTNIKAARANYYLSLNQPAFVGGWLSRLSKFPTLTIAAGSGLTILIIIVAAILIFSEK